MTQSSDALAAGRAALARNDWQAAHEAFAAAGGGPEADAGLADAAFWLDRPEELFDAAEPVNAVREARRVTRPGGVVVAVTWGAAEQCEAAGFLLALGALMPPPPPGTPGPFALSAPGVLERLLEEAGLRVGDEGTVTTCWRFADEAALLRGLLAGGPAVRAIEHSDERRVAAATLDAVAPYRTATGGYAIENVWRFLIGTV